MELPKAKGSKFAKGIAGLWKGGRKKTESDSEFTDLARAESSFDMSGRSSQSETMAPKGAPEPTPLARRTRAGRAKAA